MGKLPDKKVKEIQKEVSDTLEIEPKKVSVFVQKDRLKLPPNIMVFQAFAYMAATKLKPATNRVLMLLFSKSVYENFISMDIKTIAEELKISVQSIVSAMNELVDNNIVLKIKHPIDKRRHDYFINPVAAWKGNSFTRLASMRQIDKKQLSMFDADEKNDVVPPADPLEIKTL